MGTERIRGKGGNSQILHCIHQTKGNSPLTKTPNDNNLLYPNSNLNQIKLKINSNQNQLIKDKSNLHG